MRKSIYPTSVVMNFLFKEKPEQFKHLSDLRLENPQSFETELEIVSQELRNTKESLYSYDVSTENSFIKQFVEEDTEVYSFGSNPRKFFSTEECRRLTQTVYKESGDNKNLVFFIGDNTALQGKLINKLNETSSLMPLVTAFEKHFGDQDVTKFQFFTSKKIGRGGWKETAKIKEWMYSYQFLSKDKREYFVFSSKELSLEYGLLEGNIVLLDDKFPIGAQATIQVNRPIIILNRWHPFNKKITTKEQLKTLLEKLKLSKKKFYNYLFCHSEDKVSYNQPKLFREMISACLFSYNYGGYPLHLFLLGPPGIGKSKIEEAIYDKFDEVVGIVDGGTSTMKSLIPSFKGTIPQIGSMLKSHRICVIDEFLRILSKVDVHNRNEQLAVLNTIYEHKKRDAGSGNGRVTMNPSMKVISVSNPIWNTQKMINLCNKIDTSFLSRNLIHYYDGRHIQQIETNELIEEPFFTMDKNYFISIYDYLNSFKASFDEKRVREIYEKGLAYLGDDTENNKCQTVREVYTARYELHLKKLIDGIIKTRCLCDSDMSFAAAEVDYQLLEKISFYILLNWNIIEVPFVKDELRGKITEETIQVN